MCQALPAQARHNVHAICAWQFRRACSKCKPCPAQARHNVHASCAWQPTGVHWCLPCAPCCRCPLATAHQRWSQGWQSSHAGQQHRQLLQPSAQGQAAPPHPFRGEQMHAAMPAALAARLCCAHAARAASSAEQPLQAALTTVDLHAGKEEVCAAPYMECNILSLIYLQAGRPEAPSSQSAAMLATCMGHATRSRSNQLPIPVAGLSGASQPVQQHATCF